MPPTSVEAERAFSAAGLFSSDEATLYEGVSVRPSDSRMDGRMDDRSVTSSLFSLLGATNAVYTALL